MLKLLAVFCVIFALGGIAWRLYQSENYGDALLTVVCIIALGILSGALYYDTKTQDYLWSAVRSYQEATHTYYQQARIHLPTEPSDGLYEVVISKSGDLDGDWIPSHQVPEAEHNEYRFFRLQLKTAK